VPLSNFAPRGFGFVHHSIAILYHQVPNPSITIRHFFIAVWWRGQVDQYAGRLKRSTGGRQWHDWKGESLAFRLLHASGRVALCTV
jgi:hypothetical protein